MKYTQPVHVHCIPYVIQALAETPSGPTNSHRNIIVCGTPKARVLMSKFIIVHIFDTSKQCNRCYQIVTILEKVMILLNVTKSRNNQHACTGLVLIETEPMVIIMKPT